ncbi:hypothetical protein DSO57_1023385 [Entomophthora muscae]|uniref:Uncharacterized protein n=1 Tax=Entomophthora muscae TaxID=34485 RepID=A0ACC2TQ67_9FUNG|nr:hypothetical protein DSO57_1023385 [Entomophthora muscae]
MERIPARGKYLGTMSNLANAQEAVQLYLNKKSQKGGPLGEEGDCVRIDNSSSLETQAWEQDLNPTLDSLGPLALRTKGPPVCVFLKSSPYKLIPRMLAHMVKQDKPRKSTHQMKK